MSTDNQVTILDVAQYIINNLEEDTQYLTPKQLQNLCFLINQYSIIYQWEPMFKDKFQMNVTGPCNLELYNIIINNINDCKDIHGFYLKGVNIGDTNNLSEDNKEIILKFCSIYKSLIHPTDNKCETDTERQLATTSGCGAVSIGISRSLSLDLGLSDLITQTVGWYNAKEDRIGFIRDYDMYMNTCSLFDKEGEND